MNASVMRLHQIVTISGVPILYLDTMLPVNLASHPAEVKSYSSIVLNTGRLRATTAEVIWQRPHRFRGKFGPFSNAMFLGLPEDYSPNRTSIRANTDALQTHTADWEYIHMW